MPKNKPPLSLTSLQQTLSREKVLYLKIKALPKSPKTELTDILPDQTLKIRLKAQPEKGQANEKLIRFLAREFAVSKENVTILSGKTQPTKLIRIKT